MKARQKLDETQLTPVKVYKLLSVIFPKANDYAPSESGYVEELSELREFSIRSIRDLRLLLKRHRREIISIDRSPINAYHQKMYREEMGDAVFLDHMKKCYWFALPAILRIALELEFGEQYTEFAHKRDNI
ncbi:hypothetical protein VST7929_02959 [Vibrio stylophorae]|uniref:Uncharacterized protein n=1 Tax=Vibrio stylophorae TaxID=659351 RepID=A0ABM8ZXD8_9VIBR|nr:hypothetical protein [Vibrio stylophorae]CAH0535386.1 hypothetical protein VST7929_02959 [Vibrio stylophorae]